MDLTQPHRCQATTKAGQCRRQAAYGSEYCDRHGRGENLLEVEKLNGYLLAKAEERARLASLSAELEPVRELKDAVALQHMLIERRYNLIKDDNDLLQACGPLNQMLHTMERLISSCHKIEQNLGQLLAKQTVFFLAKQMVEIIMQELEGIDDYEIIVDRITERLVATVSQARPQLESE